MSKAGSYQGKIWKVNNLLSHFDGSYHYPYLRLRGVKSFWVVR